MTRKPSDDSDDKKVGGVHSPQRDESRKQLDEDRFREGHRTWNVEPIKQTTEPKPRPKK